MKTWKKIEETKKRTGDITNLKKRNEEKVQKVSKVIFNANSLLYRKSLILNWIMSKKDICLRITTWFLNRDTRRKEKFKMLFYSKRKKKQNNLKWLNNRMNKEKDKICLELNKRTRWRIKLDFNLRDLLKWKWRKREDENKLQLKEIMEIDATRRKI